MTVLFDRVCIIGIGLIGSSLARAIRQYNLADQIVCADRSPQHRTKALELGLVDDAFAEEAEAVRQADLTIFCVPIGAYASVAGAIGPALKPGSIVTDVGSVKQAVLRDVAPHIPQGVHFVPGHPIAGTEHSGPEAGFAALFSGRWAILTPLPDTAPEAVSKVKELWEAIGSKVEIMEPAHHDRVLAITSHLPHLIAYTIVGTAADLETDTQSEVIKFSAGGFRDFTRIAASDPTMWRDIFLNNREAVLEIAQRLTEDLTALQKAIRRGDGDTLFDLFTRTQSIRRGVISAKQA
jgi:cyclohexadieny/prephenate dehydrogenase